MVRRKQKVSNTNLAQFKAYIMVIFYGSSGIARGRRKGKQCSELVEKFKGALAWAVFEKLIYT